MRVQVSKLTLCVKNLQWHHSQSPQGSGKELPRAVPFAQNWDLHLQIRCFSNMNSLLFKITVSCCSSQNWSGGAPGSRVHSISWLFGRTTPGGAPSLSSIFISSPIFSIYVFFAWMIVGISALDFEFSFRQYLSPPLYIINNTSVQAFQCSSYTSVRDRCGASL